MNDQEMKLAEELEQIIQAAQANQPMEPQAMPSAEAELAQNLVELSQNTQASPAFVASMRAKLRQRALQIQKKPPEKASFWRDLQQMLKDELNMKRTLALGAILILIIFIGATAISGGLIGGGQDVALIPTVPVATLPEASATAVADEPLPENTPAPVLPPSELAQLPRFEGQSAVGGFGGGGGGDATSSEAASVPIVDGDFDLKMMDPFSGTTFILDTTLPLDTQTGAVWQRPAEVPVDANTAQQIAAQFGFSGPLYIETYPGEVPDSESDPRPQTFLAFDGSKALRVDAWSINYWDDVAGVNVNYEVLTPHPNALAIAESFLNERGLLNFPYTAEAQEGYEVFFYRNLEGTTVNDPEIVVSINTDGEIIFVYDNNPAEWVNLGTYPLISAEQAWQQVLGGILENNIQYSMMPADFGEPLPVDDPAFAEEYQYWPRTFTPGSDVHLYEWPQVYRPVNGGTPLLKMRQYTLLADEAALNAMADAREQQLHVWGTLNADNTISVAGWEALNTYEPIFQQGVVRRQDDQLLFYGQEGNIYILPEAPADIEHGLEVNVFGYGIRDAGLNYPVLDWESIDKYIEYPEPGIEEPLPVEPLPGEPLEPFEPFRYGSVTVNEVGLAHSVTYLWPEIPEDQITRRPSPTIVLQPAWVFTGTADNGDEIKLFVQAVEEAYLQP